MPNTPHYSLSIYGSHDSSICIHPSPNVYRIYELERITKQRNYSLNNDPNYREVLQKVKELIIEEYGIFEFASLFYGQIKEDVLLAIQEIFGPHHWEEMSHHAGHASGALYQSPFDEAIIFSYDSGGHEMNEGISTFCVYHGDKRKEFNHNITKISNLPIDVCHPYTLLAVPIADIRKNDIWTDYLKYAGKIMGLSAYGKVRNEWIVPIKKFYYQFADMPALLKLGKELGLDFGTQRYTTGILMEGNPNPIPYTKPLDVEWTDIKTITGPDAYDLARTSQNVFEEIMLNAITPFIERYRLPVILTGGGALNVLLNQTLKNTIDYPVFVPVNPNDCGIAFGFTMLRNPPEPVSAQLREGVQVQYNGLGLLDIKTLQLFIYECNPSLLERGRGEVKTLARLLAQGKIIGVVRGNSECGPRALGNRSILCYPGFPEMKEKINRIKQREFYRPFAPVCKQEDANIYFEDQAGISCVSPPSSFGGRAGDGGLQSPFMSYAPFVKEQYKSLVPAIVHADGTARVQTVTKQQNEWLYMLIDAVETITGTGILLNTSFNIKGQPILSSIADALHVLDTTELDYVLIEDYLFEKKR